MNGSSCEPRRSSAYSEDLRYRMLWQREALGLSYGQISQNLGVDKSTVQRTVALFNRTGSLSKRPYPKQKVRRKISSLAELYILNLVVQKPGVYLHEIQEELQEFLLLEISISTICKFLCKSGFTRQRLRTVALQQDQLLRQQFVIDISVYSRETFIFIDETGSDQRNLLRKYGYSVRGRPAKTHVFFNRGERISAIACMSAEGLLDVRTVKGTTDSTEFYLFVQNHLLPHLMPFNAHSVVVVMDNCSIHHIAEITKSINEVGALVHFLPPYSPDYNPIEELFSKVKTRLKSLDKEMPSITDLETLLLSSFTCITEEECNAWISDSEIYN